MADTCKNEPYNFILNCSIPPYQLKGKPIMDATDQYDRHERMVFTGQP